MARNPMGYVPVYDGGVPRIITGIAAANISGGNTVYFSGAVDSVSSGLDSFKSTDLAVVNCTTGSNFNGIALADTASGNECAVATRGCVIVRADGAVTCGQNVMVTANGHAFSNLAAISGEDVQTSIESAAGRIAGRALTSTATSGNFVIIDLTP